MSKLRYIKSFDSFKINEVNLGGTYLDPSKNVAGKSDNTKSLGLTRYGKTFAEAPKTAGKSYGLKFVEKEGEPGFYFVVFPDNFIQNFKDQIPVSLRKNIPQNIDMSKTGFKAADKSKFGEEEGRRKYQIEEPKKTDVEFQKGVVDWKGLDGLYIYLDPDPWLKKYNRIHFPKGISKDLLGTGLGYIIYEEFIKFFGFACSADDASPSAQKIWTKLVADPDFYYIIKSSSDFIQEEFNPFQLLPSVTEGVFVVVKNKVDESASVIKDYIKEALDDKHIVRLIASDELVKKFPEIKNKMKIDSPKFAFKFS
jgi:hypothetical protein